MLTYQEYQEYQEKIRDAAIILDREFPNWHNKIDISKLDMSHNNRCIVGQLYGNYSEKSPLDNLFSLTHRDNPFGTDAPKEIWVAEINNRLKPKELTLAQKYAKVADLCKQYGFTDDQNKYNDLAIGELLAL